MKSRFLKLFRREILRQERFDLGSTESQPRIARKPAKRWFQRLRPRRQRSESVSGPRHRQPTAPPPASAPSSRWSRQLTQAVVEGDSANVRRILESAEEKEEEEELEDVEEVLHFACDNKDTAVVTLLLSHGASPDRMGEERDCAPIHIAVRSNCLAVASLLLGHGACLDIGTKFEKRTPLHIASTLGYTEMVDFLLENRVRVDQRDIYGSTALHMAARMGHVTVARALLDHGAGVDEYNNDGWTALHLAAERGNAALVELLLVEKRAAVDRQNRFGRTALHWASAGAHLDAALVLVRHGASATVADANGRSPVDYADNDRLRAVITGTSPSPPPPPHTPQSPANGKRGRHGIGQLVEIDSRSKWDLCCSGHISRQTLAEEEEKMHRKAFVRSPLQQQQQQQQRNRQMRHYRSCDDFLSTDDGRRSPPRTPWRGRLRGAESVDAVTLDGLWTNDDCNSPASSHSPEHLTAWTRKRTGDPLSTTGRGRRMTTETVGDSDTVKYVTDTLHWSRFAVRTLEEGADPFLTAQVEVDDGFAPAPDPFQAFFHFFVCHVARFFDGWKRLIQGLCLAVDRESDALRTVTRAATARDSDRRRISRSMPDMAGHQSDQTGLVVSLSVCAVVFVHRSLEEEREQEEAKVKVKRMLRLMTEVFEDDSSRIVVRNFVRILSSVSDAGDVTAPVLDEFCSLAVNHLRGCSQFFVSGLSAHLLFEPERRSPVTPAGKVDSGGGGFSVDDVISRWKWKTTTDGTSSVLENTTDLLVALIELGREDIAAKYGRSHRLHDDDGGAT